MKKRRAGKVSVSPAPGTRPASPGPWSTPGLVHRYLDWAAIFCATLIAYLPALGGGLLWDDNHHVTRPELQSLHGLWRIWFDPAATQQYYPLLHSAFWLEHRMWGDAALGYHLVNVALHAAAACLVLAIARRLALPGARLAAFVFALHPVCVEAVAWISEQKSTLSAVFYLAAALVYLHFDRSRRRSLYIAAAGLFVAAVLAKTVTATLPAALLVVLWWQQGRLRWKRDALPLLPWFAFGVPAGIVTAWIERTSIGAQGADFALTLLERFLLASRAVWFYLGKVLWPANLMFTYPRWTLDAATWWQYLFPAGLLGLLIGLCIVARRHRGPLAGFLIFAGTLFPVLGFLNVYPFLFAWVADHFQYLASLGIIVPAASALAMAAPRILRGRTAAATAGAVLAGALGVMTWRQCGMYRDSETLYRATLERNPASWMAHTNLCALLSENPTGLAEAIRQCEAALRIRPDYAEAHNDLGTALARVPGRVPEAIAHFEAAIRAKPAFAEAHFNLANALVFVPGRLPEAIAEYRAACRIRPDYLEARMNLATVLARVPGGLPEAIAEYRAVIAIAPNLAEPHNNLAGALAEIPERQADAIREYRTALRLKPDYAKAHNNLGVVLARSGDLDAAIAEYTAAVRDNPVYADAHYNLAMALARAGRTAEAERQFEETLRIEPGAARARSNLEILLREKGPSQPAVP